MMWFWLNMPLAAVFFLAITGVPLWLVIRHPDAAPAAETAGRDATRRPAAAVAALPEAQDEDEAVGETVGAAA